MLVDLAHGLTPEIALAISQIACADIYYVLQYGRGNGASAIRSS